MKLHDESRRRMLSVDRAELERASEQRQIWSTHILVTVHVIEFGDHTGDKINSIFHFPILW